jgi:hypothetical protein
MTRLTFKLEDEISGLIPTASSGLILVPRIDFSNHRVNPSDDM